MHNTNANEEWEESKASSDARGGHGVGEYSETRTEQKPVEGGDETLELETRSAGEKPAQRKPVLQAPSLGLAKKMTSLTLKYTRHEDGQDASSAPPLRAQPGQAPIGGAFSPRAGQGAPSRPLAQNQGERQIRKTPSGFLRSSSSRVLLKNLVNKDAEASPDSEGPDAPRNEAKGNADEANQSSDIALTNSFELKKDEAIANQKKVTPVFLHSAEPLTGASLFPWYVLSFLSLLILSLLNIQPPNLLSSLWPEISPVVPSATPLWDSTSLAQKKLTHLCRVFSLKVSSVFCRADQAAVCPKWPHVAAYCSCSQPLSYSRKQMYIVLERRGLHSTPPKSYFVYSQGSRHRPTGSCPEVSSFLNCPAGPIA